MKIHLTLFFLYTLASLIIGNSQTSYAQSSPKYKNPYSQNSKNYKHPYGNNNSIFPPTGKKVKGQPGQSVLNFDGNYGIVEMGISVLKTPEIMSDQFILRLSPLDKQITGCHGKETYTYEAGFKDTFFDVAILDVTVDTANLPQNPHYECGALLNEISIDIIISKNDLKNNGTKFLRLSSGPFLDFFEILNAKNHIELIHSDEMSPAQYYIEQNKSAIKDTLKVWFYPEDTYILYAPHAEKVADNLEGKIQRLAKRHGLEPLETIFPDFESPITAPSHFYYVDQNKKFTKELGDQTGGFVDNIYNEVLIYELEEDVPVLKPVAVYARKPVIYE